MAQAVVMNKSIMKVLSLTGILICLGLYSMGQSPVSNYLNGSIQGNSGDGIEILGGAAIYWEGTNTGTLSDTNGQFQIAKVKGHNQLIVRYLGYRQDTLEVGDNQEEVSITLELDGEQTTVEINSRLNSRGFSRLDPRGVELIRESEFNKAACCNLSESFETNPSVDASFTDAVTGTKQIKMLGLSGKYVSITTENMPLLSGLASVNGLAYYPSLWLEGLQLSKGTGSVVNGFEGIAGQINIDHHDPDSKKKLIWDGYYNQGGRMESNLVINKQLNEKVGTSLMLHGGKLNQVNDRNGDGFVDMPLRTELSGLNRWRFNSGKGLVGQVNLSGLHFRNQGGQIQAYSKDFVPSIPYFEYDDRTDRFQAFAKGGYVDQEHPDRSIGTQWMYLHHDQEAIFGSRRYQNRQRAFYGNIIAQTNLSSEIHQMKSGVSLRLDNFQEGIRWTPGDSVSFNRKERTAGFFAEYSYLPSEKFSMVVGLRGDVHNYYGTFMTPRVHLRYAPLPTTSFRLSGGRGQRSPNVLSDQLGLLASARTWQIDSDPGLPGYGLQPEIGWNIGASITQEFFLDFREGVIRAEAYRTRFTEQVVIDREDPELVQVYQLNGPSFANSFLIEGSYEVVKRLDLRLAYRYYDVQTRYKTGLLLQPFNPRHRGFANFAYSTRKSGWSFDATWQWVGSQRVPGQVDSPSFTMISSQINKKLGKNWEIYAGGENLLDYRQDKPILGADRPFSTGFDASLVWGPVFGRNIYTGVRLTLLKSE